MHALYNQLLFIFITSRIYLCELKSEKKMLPKKNKPWVRKIKFKTISFNIFNKTIEKKKYMQKAYMHARLEKK